MRLFAAEAGGVEDGLDGRGHVREVVVGTAGRPGDGQRGVGGLALGGGGGGLQGGEVGGRAGAEVGFELWGVEAFAQFGGALWRLGVFGFVADLLFDGAEDAGAGVGGGVERVVRWGWGFMRVYRNIDL